MKKRNSYLLVLFAAGLLFFQACDDNGDEGPEQNPYLQKVLGKWLAWKEIHESIRKNTTDTLSILESNDTNLLNFTETYLLTYHIYTTDTTQFITEFYKSMTDSVIYFGGYPFNTGEIILATDSSLIFKRFKGWYVPMDTQDTIHHLVTYYCDRFKDPENR